MGKSQLAERRGRFSVDLGRRDDGRQPRFYLGTDQKAAEERKARLEQLWSSVLSNGEQAWSDNTLSYADAIRRGEVTCTVAP